MSFVLTSQNHELNIRPFQQDLEKWYEVKNNMQQVFHVYLKGPKIC